MTPEEIINKAKRLGKYTDWSQESIDNNTKWIVKIMQEYGRQEFNRALDLAAEKATVIPFACADQNTCSCNGNCEHPIYFVSKQSILNLKQK